MTQVLMAVAASNGTNSTADEVLHGVDEIVNETLEPAVEREALAEGVGSTFFDQYHRKTLGKPQESGGLMVV